MIITIRKYVNEDTVAEIIGKLVKKNAEIIFDRVTKRLCGRPRAISEVAKAYGVLKVRGFIKPLYARKRYFHDEGYKMVIENMRVFIARGSVDINYKIYYNLFTLKNIIVEIWCCGVSGRLGFTISPFYVDEEDIEYYVDLFYRKKVLKLCRGEVRNRDVAPECFDTGIKGRITLVLDEDS